MKKMITKRDLIFTCMITLTWAQYVVAQVTDTVKVQLQEKPIHLNFNYIKSYGPAFTHLASRPAHWNKNEWVKFTSITLGIGMLSLADPAIKHAIQRHRSVQRDKVANFFSPFGNNYAPYSLISAFAIGALIKNDRIHRVALNGMQSLLLTTVAYSAINGVVRRQRPAYTDNQYHFSHPYKDGYTSFPSGHTTTIVSFATALALEFQEEKWVGYTAYTLAGLTAGSRLYFNRHWSTDVATAAFLSYFLTKSVYKWQRKQQLSSKKPSALIFSFHPVFYPK
ncbi:Membrane-associated phospholipid phosphatase [bacterium A37T11]|nr:Membrane-associated phospholipid phosphatase [bacterium A37T11]